MNGADAVLRRDGFIVEGHASRLAYPELPKIFRDNAGLLSEIRTARNAAQYDAAGRVDAQFAQRAIALASAALEEVASVVPR